MDTANISKFSNITNLFGPWFACPLCRALSNKRALCAHCAEKLYDKREPLIRRHSHMTIKSLFSWRKDDWLGLRWWAMALKRKEHIAYWREPALWTLETFAPDLAHFGLADGLRPNTVLVPIPSSSGENHARGFARALSHYTGWPVDERLTLTTHRAQKKLNRRERQYRTFEVTVAAEDIIRPRSKSGNAGATASRQAAACSQYTNVILIDDIVTTGATVKAAAHALNTHRHVEVWCLLDRRPLR